MKPIAYTYCVCRINPKYYGTINANLKDRGYKNVKAIIPTIRLLKKTHKGINSYETIPMLFNYGFIRMKSTRAYDRNYLNCLKKDIIGIVSWVNGLESVHPKKKRKRVDNAEDFDDFSMVATINKQEIHRLQSLSKANRIYGIDEITQVNIGDYIVLRGYPFEGVAATIEEVNVTTKAITVTIYTHSGSMTLKLPFDNVLYSIYKDFDEDKLHCTPEEYDLSQIPEGTSENILTNKQY